MKKTSEIYSTFISFVINELVSNEFINSYDQKLKASEGLLSDILQHRLFPGKLVFQCLKDFRNKTYVHDKFVKKISQVEDVVYYFETNALSHYGIINYSVSDALFYSRNKLMSVSTGLHLFLNESSDCIYCRDCTFENNAKFMSRFNVKSKELICSNTTLWTEVMFKLKKSVLKE